MKLRGTLIAAAVSIGALLTPMSALAGGATFWVHVGYEINKALSSPKTPPATTKPAGDDAGGTDTEKDKDTDTESEGGTDTATTPGVQGDGCPPGALC